MRLHPPWSFDIDWYLNKVVPPPPWRHVPYPVAHFFGYRKGPQHDIGDLAPVFWCFIGVFCSIAAIEAVNLNLPEFKDRDVPIIVGSFVSLTIR